MRRVLAALLTLGVAAGFVRAATAAPPADRSGVELRVLRSDASVLEIEWTSTEPALREVATKEGTAHAPVLRGGVHLAEAGAPDVMSIVRLVAVPADGPLPRVTVSSVETGSLTVADLAPAPVETFEEGESTVIRSRADARFESGFVPARWAELEGETSLRGQRVARLVLHPHRWDSDRGELQWARRLVVRVEFPENVAGRSAPRRDREPFEEMLDATVLNAEVGRAWRTAAAPDRRGTGDSFDSAPTWLRFPIRESGVYRLDYFTFANLGVDPATIDPRTIRVFSGTNLLLREDLRTPNPDFMTECSLKDLGDGDSVFDTDDRFLFWALAPYGWANQFDPAQPRTEFIENFYTDETVYWITWGGTFSDSPHRMSTRSVSDDTATEFATTAPWRLHYEQNNAENFRYRDEDGWIWEDLRGRGTDRLYLLDAPNVASGDGFLTARLMSHDLGAQRTVELKIGTTPITFWQWCHGANTALYEVTGCFENMLTNGTNSIRINANTGNTNASDQIYTAWFDLEYERTLRAESGRRLLFFADEVMPSLPNPPAVTSFCTVAQPAEVCPTPPANLVYGQTAFQLAGFDAAPADIYLFDVSDQHDIVELTDFNVLGSAPHDVRFSDPGLTGTRWYTAVTMDGVRSLEAGEVAQLRGLRSTQNGADYAVVYHPDFEAGAERLAELRARPTSFDNLTTVAIDIDDIYQEFSWGMRDPLALRDFLAWTVVGWAGGAPFYVALLGDSAYDTKGFLPGSPEDLVSTYTQRYRISSTQYVGGDNLNFYSTDDFFGYLEPEDFDPQLQPGLEAAIGRFPVQTTAELDLMLDKLDTYLSYTSPGLWQNRVVLVADDERTLSDTVREPFHTTQVEELAETWFPDSIDPVKIYLVNYPRNTFGKKPEAQAAFIEEFTRGALHTSYTGHGDASTMAQEEVFVSQKIPEILNEDRYTIFSTFSCTVSRFDLLSGDSMTELLLKYPEGGAVTTFASGGLVFPVLSSELNQQWLSGIYGTPYVIPTDARTVRPIGQAAVAAKAVVNTSGNATRNSEKYVTLGDPALRPRFGSEQIRFDPATVDSQATDGLLRRIDGYVIDEQSGLVLDGTGGTTAFNGQAWVHVTELPNDRGYDYTDANGTPQHIDFTLDGPTAFRGTVPVVNGRFTAKFFLGEGITPGNTGRISVFGLEDAGSGGVFRDASGAYEALVLAPTISPSQVPDDLEGPRVTIRFEGYDRFVNGDQVFTDKPVLVVELEDPSGINLRPFPQFARLEAELDGNERIDLASDFSYDDAAFTQGRVRRIMPMAPGKHTLEVKAFDNVNNRGTDRVEFEIVLADAEFDLVDDYVAVYPNPFRSRTDFLYRLTQDADVEFLVYTITGRRVWELTTRGVAGDNVIRWDGRDSNGSPVANGTYLFKMKARYTDTEGAIERDEYVGKVVRMQ